jgi:hypothetical protein
LHFSPLATASAPDGLKAGGRLELRRPDGTRIYPTLYGLDWPSPSRGKLGLSVDKSLTKADVPFGTEIWTASCYCAARFIVLFPLSRIDHDGFGEAILGAHAVLVPEKLCESEPALEDRRSVSKRTFDGLPQSESFAGQRHRARASDKFARRAAVAEIIECGPVEQHHNDVSGFVEIPFEVDVGFVE